MNKYLFSALILFVHGSIKSQDRTDQIKLNRNVDLLETIDLGERGFLIKTGKDYMASKKQDWKISYFSSEMELVWEVPIEKTQINKGFKNEIVAAPGGKYVYHVENKGYNTIIGANKKFLTQIDKEGNTKTHELVKVKKIGHIQMIFCDDTYLYFLATANGQEIHKTKKKNEKLILNRIDHSDFTYTQLVLDLPKIEDPKISSFWSYAGHDNHGIYLLSKIINKREGKYQFNIVKVNADGSIVKTILIELPLDGKHIRPSDNFNFFYGNHQSKYNDFYIYQKTMTKDIGMSKDIRMSKDIGIKPEIGAFGNILIENNNIYVYGLYGLKPFRGFADKYEGYFIHQYDFEGKRIWAVQNEVSNELADEDYFRLHAAPDGRNLMLKLRDDKDITFHLWIKKQIYSFNFSDKGKMIEAYIDEFDSFVGISEVKLCHTSSRNVILMDYVKSLSRHEKKKTGDFYFSNAEGEIIVENKPKEGLINLLYFNNSN